MTDDYKYGDHSHDDDKEVVSHDAEEALTQQIVGTIGSLMVYIESHLAVLPPDGDLRAAIAHWDVMLQGQGKNNAGFSARATKMMVDFIGQYREYTADFTSWSIDTELKEILDDGET